MEELSNEKEVITYKHEGFWSPVETKRDRNALEELWDLELAPWKIW